VLTDAQLYLLAALVLAAIALLGLGTIIVRLVRSSRVEFQCSECGEWFRDSRRRSYTIPQSAMEKAQQQRPRVRPVCPNCNKNLNRKGKP
jgi:hypothetical protein